MRENQDLCEAVMRILRDHYGRSKAIKGKEIARLLGFRDDRQVRQAIRELIARGIPIASVTESPAGYFLIEEPAEALDYQQALRSRLIEDALRLRDFKKGVAHYLGRGVQGRLV